MSISADNPEFEKPSSFGVIGPNLLAHEATKCLDALQCGCPLEGEGSPFSAELQRAAVDRIHSGAERMCGETPGDDDRAVFVDLVGGLDYREQSAKFIGLDENLLSLPPEGAEPKPLPGLLGPTGEDDVLQFKRTAVLPTQDRSAFFRQRYAASFH